MVPINDDKEEESADRSKCNYGCGLLIRTIERLVIEYPLHLQYVEDITTYQQYDDTEIKLEPDHQEVLPPPAPHIRREVFTPEDGLFCQKQFDKDIEKRVQKYVTKAAPAAAGTSALPDDDDRDEVNWLVPPDSQRIGWGYATDLDVTRGSLVAANSIVYYGRLRANVAIDSYSRDMFIEELAYITRRKPPPAGRSWRKDMSIIICLDHNPVNIARLKEVYWLRRKVIWNAGATPSGRDTNDVINHLDVYIGEFGIKFTIGVAFGGDCVELYRSPVHWILRPMGTLILSSNYVDDSNLMDSIDNIEELNQQTRLQVKKGGKIIRFTETSLGLLMSDRDKWWPLWYECVSNAQSFVPVALLLVLRSLDQGCVPSKALLIKIWLHLHVLKDCAAAAPDPERGKLLTWAMQCLTCSQSPFGPLNFKDSTKIPPQQQVEAPGRWFDKVSPLEAKKPAKEAADKDGKEESKPQEQENNSNTTSKKKKVEVEGTMPAPRKELVYGKPLMATGTWTDMVNDTPPCLAEQYPNLAAGDAMKYYHYKSHDTIVDHVNSQGSIAASSFPNKCAGGHGRHDYHSRNTPGVFGPTANKWVLYDPKECEDRSRHCLINVLYGLSLGHREADDIGSTVTVLSFDEDHVRRQQLKKDAEKEEEEKKKKKKQQEKDKKKGPDGAAAAAVGGSSSSSSSSSVGASSSSVASADSRERSRSSSSTRPAPGTPVKSPLAAATLIITPPTLRSTINSSDHELSPLLDSGSIASVLVSPQVAAIPSRS